MYDKANIDGVSNDIVHDHDAVVAHTSKITRSRYNSLTYSFTPLYSLTHSLTLTHSYSLTHSLCFDFDYSLIIPSIVNE